MAGQSYSFVDGTFHFFKVFGQRPGATISLIIWHVVINLALSALFLLAISPAVPLVFELAEQNRDPDVADILTLLGSVWLAALVAYIGTFIVLLMVQGAWLRHLTHGRTASGIPFRFGGDEWRLLGVNICFWLMGLVASIVVFVLIAVMAAATGSPDDLDQGLGALGAGGLALLLIVGLPLTIFIALRLAAAPAMTVNEGRFQLFSSFPATRSIWGWMLLSYVVLYFVIMFGSSVIFGFVTLFGTAGMMDIAVAGQSLPSGSDASDYFGLLLRPLPLVTFTIGLTALLVVQSMVEAIWHSVGAYAALRHSGDAEAEPDYVVPSASVGDAPSEG